jgi:acyl-CoA thioesterase-1
MKLPMNMMGSYRDNFDKAFEKIAKQKKTPFYPFLLEGVAANPQLNIADQIHPNAKGYEIISKNLTKFIKSHLN